MQQQHDLAVPLAELHRVEHQVAHGDLHPATVAPPPDRARPYALPMTGSRRRATWTWRRGGRRGRRRRRARPGAARRLPAHRGRRGGDAGGGCAAPSSSGTPSAARRRRRPGWRCGRSSTSTCRPAGGCGGSCRWSCTRAPPRRCAPPGSPCCAPPTTASPRWRRASSSRAPTWPGARSRPGARSSTPCWPAAPAPSPCSGAAADLGLDLAAPHAVLVVAGTERPLRGRQRRGPAGPAGARAAGPVRRRRAAAAVKGGDLVCIFAAPDEAAVAQVRTAVGGADGERAGPRRWRGAVGRPLAGPDGVRASYEQARDALDLAERLAPAGPGRRRRRRSAVYRVLLRDREALDELIAARSARSRRPAAAPGRCWRRWTRTSPPAASPPRPRGGCTCRCAP